MPVSCIIDGILKSREYLYLSISGVGKVRPAGQIWPVSSVDLARGGSPVLTLNLPLCSYQTHQKMSIYFHAERGLVAH